MGFKISLQRGINAPDYLNQYSHKIMKLNFQKLLLTIFFLLWCHGQVFSRQPNTTVNGCHIGGRVYQDRDVSPLRYLGLPVYYDNGVNVYIPGMSREYPCYGYIATSSSCRLCLSKNSMGICQTYDPVVGNIYTFTSPEVNCPLDDYASIMILGFALIYIYWIKLITHNKATSRHLS